MDRADFVHRVRSCERRLYRVARTLLRCDQDCEDAVQEALLRAWARLHTLREPLYFETWLIRILINECKNLCRRRPRQEMQLSGELSLQVQDASPVLDALLSLPEKQRITLELHYIEGFKTREIAGMLGIPEGSVKWRLSAGRRRLKREFGEEAQS